MSKPISKTTLSAYFTESNPLQAIRAAPRSHYYHIFIKKFAGYEIPKNQITELLSLTQYPHSHSVVYEGDPLYSFHSKIQKYMHDVKKNLVSPQKTEGLPTLNYLPLLRNLVGQIIHPAVPETVERARHTLLLLEKMEPCLESLNYEISQFLTHADEKSRTQSLKRLQAFAASPLEPMQIHFPMKPWSPHPSSTYRSLLPKSEPIVPIVCRETHDAFWHLEGILIGHDAGCYLDNLKEIAEKEGLSKIINFAEIPHIPETKWLRDTFVILENREILIPSRINLVHPDDPRGFMTFSNRKRKLGDLIAHLCAHPFDEGILGSVADKHLSEQWLHAPIHGVREAPFYFEGGNLLPAVNQAGEKIYLSGANNLLFSMLNSHFIFSNTQEKMNLLQEIRNLEGTPSFSKDHLLLVQERLENAGLLSQFPSIQEKKWIAQLTIAATKYMEKQIAAALGCPLIIIGEIFQAPVEFHLDMFLMPAPEGVIFIQDFELCKTVLNHILQSYPLSENEKKRLLVYLQETELKQKTHGEQLKAISQKLETAGFKVLPLPGAYYEKSGRRSVNLLNSLMGIGKRGQFCISNGSSHPADRYLRDAFTNILHAHGISHVYFTGKETKKTVFDPLTPFAYPAAESGIEDGGGFHCRTQEIHRSMKEFAIIPNPSLPPAPLRSGPVKDNSAEAQRQLHEIGEKLEAWFKEFAPAFASSSNNDASSSSAIPAQSLASLNAGHEIEQNDQVLKNHETESNTENDRFAEPFVGNSLPLFYQEMLRLRNG